MSGARRNVSRADRARQSAIFSITAWFINARRAGVAGACGALRSLAARRNAQHTICHSARRNYELRLSLSVVQPHDGYQRQTHADQRVLGISPSSRVATTTLRTPPLFSALRRRV